MGGDDRLTFVPLDQELANVISSWWEDSETRKWMGGYPPSKALELASSHPAEFRGRKVVGRTALVGLANGDPISLIDFEKYEDGTAGLALIVSPIHRNKGWGRRALRALIDSTEVEGLERLFAGIEPENVTSVRCFEGAGFTPMSHEPDQEGIIYFEFMLQ